MENIDDIIKERLQEKIKLVVQEYQSGNIRAEVEKELETKRKEEAICCLAEKQGDSDFKNKLRRFWLEFSYNKTYYQAVENIGGNEACKNIKEKCTDILYVILGLAVIVLCYTFGWHFMDAVKEYHSDISNGQYSTYITMPIKLVCTYVFLAWTPLFLSLSFFLVSKRLCFCISFLTGGWAVYFYFMTAAAFSQLFDLGMAAIFGFLVGVLVTVFCFYLFALLCICIYDYKYDEL